ncbi:hypothetical protein CMI47_21675 [Candidatus Pacearchaeota archaeon]|nr:hypothetical protein [Candidatus Pacearchaeota archaeon]
MKITKLELKRIIKEEMQRLLKEAAYQPSRKIGMRPQGTSHYGLRTRSTGPGTGERMSSREERWRDWKMAPGEEKRWTDEGPVELDPWTELDQQVSDLRNLGVEEDTIMAKLAGTYEPPPGPAPEEKLERLADVHEMNPEANYRFWGPDHPHIQQIEDYLAQTGRALPGSQSQFQFGAKHQTPVKRRREQGLAVSKE